MPPLRNRRLIGRATALQVEDWRFKILSIASNKKYVDMQLVCQSRTLSRV